MTQPLVSVICLCYNHEEYVIRSLNSVINQSYKNIELIIVDDKSNDNSTEIIDEWIKKNSQVIKIYNKINLGNTKSFNLAAKLAKGMFIIDLAADDILLTNCIEKQVNTFENSSVNTAIVFGNAYLIDEDGNRRSTYFKVDSNDSVIDKNIFNTDYLRILGKGTVICSVSAMMKKTIFDELKGYNEALFFEDLDYWFRCARSYHIEFIDAFLVEKRVLSNSLGSQFHKSSKYNEKLNHSLEIIFKDALTRNRSKKEHKALLTRIHQELILAVKRRISKNIIRYTKLKILTHLYIYNFK